MGTYRLLLWIGQNPFYSIVNYTIVGLLNQWGVSESTPVTFCVSHGAIFQNNPCKCCCILSSSFQLRVTLSVSDFQKVLINSPAYVLQTHGCCLIYWVNASHRSSSFPVALNFPQHYLLQWVLSWCTHYSNVDMW